MTKLKFPALGSIRTVPLFKEAVQHTGESDEDFAKRKAFMEKFSCVRLKVRLLSLRDSRAFRMRVAKIWRDEHKRALKAKEAGEETFGLSEECEEALLSCNEDVCRAMLVGVSGIIVGDRDIEEMEGEELVSVMTHVGVLADTAIACKEAQDLEPEQKKS